MRRVLRVVVLQHFAAQRELHLHIEGIEELLGDDVRAPRLEGVLSLLDPPVGAATGFRSAILPVRYIVALRVTKNVVLDPVDWHPTRRSAHDAYQLTFVVDLRPFQRNLYRIAVPAED